MKKEPRGKEKKKRIESEEDAKVDEEFRAQEKSRTFDYPSRVEFKDKWESDWNQTWNVTTLSHNYLDEDCRGTA